MLYIKLNIVKSIIIGIEISMIHMYSFMFFLPIFPRENSFHDFMFASIENEAFTKGVYSEGKNLLLE